MRWTRFGRAATRLRLLTLVVATGVAPHLWAVSEYDIKAASVCNVVKFVEWPATALVSQVFTLCVADPDVLGESLHSLVQSRTVASRAIGIRKFKPGEGMQSCNAVFISSRNARKTAAILRDLQGLPVLTLGDTPEFLQSGGMIALTVVEGRLHIQISTDSVRSAGLHVDPQLLRLAQPAKGRKP